MGLDLYRISSWYFEDSFDSCSICLSKCLTYRWHWTKVHGREIRQSCSSITRVFFSFTFPASIKADCRMGKQTLKAETRTQNRRRDVISPACLAKGIYGWLRVPALPGSAQNFSPLGPFRGTVLDSGTLSPLDPRKCLQSKKWNDTIWLKAHQFTRGRPTIKDRCENFCAPCLMECESKSDDGKSDRRFSGLSSRHLCQEK